MEWPSGSLGPAGDFEPRNHTAAWRKLHPCGVPESTQLVSNKKGQTGTSVPPESNWAGPFLTSPLGLKTLGFYAAPIALRCWKHSRQKTGRPCVGRKGTVVSFPHCEQFVFVSERMGEV